MKFNISNKNEIPKSTGVYIIYFANRENKKVYVGSASGKGGFKDRWRSHIYELRKNVHHSIRLQNAYNKYKEENMVLEIIEIVEREKCFEREKFYIDQYDSFNFGYNCRPDAQGMLGFKHSKESKNKISEIAKNKKLKDVEIIKKLYLDGLSLRKIAINIKKTPSYIAGVIKDYCPDLEKRNLSFYKGHKIYQYDLNGNLIKEWPSIFECFKALNISESSVRRVLKKETRKSKNFYFSYSLLNKVEVLEEMKKIDENLKNIAKENYKKSFTNERKEKIKERSLGNNYRKKITNIYQYDLNGYLVKIWDNSKQIVDFFKLKNFSPILRVLRNKRKQFRGYRWSLANNPVKDSLDYSP